MRFAFAVTGREIRGKVVRDADGDTITILIERTQNQVRLYGIDAPEIKQPYSTIAKQALSDLVFGKAVQVVIRDKDRYGRTVGAVWIGDTNVNCCTGRVNLSLSSIIGHTCNPKGRRIEKPCQGSK